MIASFSIGETCLVTSPICRNRIEVRKPQSEGWGMARSIFGLLSPLSLTFASQVQIGRNEWEESLRSGGGSCRCLPLLATQRLAELRGSVYRSRHEQSNSYGV